jgi:hypothetical protein
MCDGGELQRIEQREYGELQILEALLFSLARLTRGRFWTTNAAGRNMEKRSRDNF